MTLRNVLERETAALPGISASVEPDGSVVWARAGTSFAAVSADGLTAEFALDPPVADAATRTPDVERSHRGRGWVRFAPPLLDDHGEDRAGAWLTSAFRRAAPLA